MGGRALAKSEAVAAVPLQIPLHGEGEGGVRGYVMQGGGGAADSGGACCPCKKRKRKKGTKIKMY